MNIILTLILILSIAPTSTADAQAILLPDIGDPSSVYFAADEERKLGLEIMRRLRERGAIVEDVQLNQYLNSIGQRIATYAEQRGTPYTFFMVRDPSINAFALPYNFIGVNAGLLLATEREDELAGVVAHEVAHVSQRHIARAIADMKRLTLPMAAAMLAGAALAAASREAGQAAMVGSMAASAQHQISFTRANEQEADRVGMQLLANAGFDPKGMSEFFHKLERMSRSEERYQLPDMLRTHPRPESRTADTQERLPQPAQRSPAPKDRKAYALAKARARALLSADNQALLRELETRLAGAGAAAFAERYAYAIALRQAGRYQPAQEQIEQLQRSDPDRLAYRIEAAEIALAAGDRAAAWRIFAAAQRLYPDDFTLAMHYGRALGTQGDAQQALRILQPHLRRYPNDAQLYMTYAQAAQRAGNQAETHATMAEYHYLSGELLAAIQQLEIGLRDPSLPPHQEARLRARLKQFRAEAVAQDLPLAKDSSRR